jgi:glycosyltransferase involved in cell wall biosynthesis
VHDIRVLYDQPGGLRNAVVLARSRYLLDQLIDESDRVLVPSNYIRLKLASRRPKRAASISVSFVVPNVETCPPDALTPPVAALIAARTPYIFYPSTIVATKNHLTLIRALAQVKEDVPDVLLVLAGSNAQSPLGVRVFELVRALGLEHRVVHLGFISEADKHALYRAAIALIVPSIGESFSLPIWEAFALGCPVIASTDRDIPEQVGDAALMCDPTNPADIAASVRRAWSDPDCRKELASKGRRRYDIARRDSLFSGWETLLGRDAEIAVATRNIDVSQAPR